MAHTLHSTLKPEGDLFGTYQEAKAAMDQMIKNLEAKGYKRMTLAIAPVRDGARMSRANGDTVDIHIR